MSFVVSHLPHRKAFEEATAALDVEIDTPSEHIGAAQTTAGTWSNSPAQSCLFGYSSTFRSASDEQISARAADIRGCTEGRCLDGLIQAKLPSVSSPHGRIAGTLAEEPQEDRFPPKRQAAMFPPRIGAVAADAAADAAADSCAPNPIDAVGVSVRRSLRRAVRRPYSARPPGAVADHAGTRGHDESNNTRFRVSSSRTALQDLTGAGDAACFSSPVERVLARRKRRRRSNFSVSSALFFSASTAEVSFPRMPEPRAQLITESGECDADVPGLCDELESLKLG